jgi:mono/diheme cytochrome c family protein
MNWLRINHFILWVGLAFFVMAKSALLSAEEKPASSASVQAPDSDGAIARGKYLFYTADCIGCHAAGGGIGGPPSGGRALSTPFGVFRAPNITPDSKYGIGSWSEEDFREAIRHGVAPGGKQLFPVFPFSSYSGMTDGDVSDIRAYIMSIPPVAEPSKPHEVGIPFGWRPMMTFWRALFFTPGPVENDPQQSAEWNRGHYLVRAVVHCAECHTPRNFFGGLKESMAFSGNIGGPDGQNAPNITSDTTSGIGNWSVEDIDHLLKTGETPDSDLVASGMASVVRGTKQLTDSDRHAIAVYIKSLPAIHTDPPPPPPK